jgi:hypothetical protein
MLFAINTMRTTKLTTAMTSKVNYFSLHTHTKNNNIVAYDDVYLNNKNKMLSQ